MEKLKEKENENIAYTENGAKAHTSTNSAVYDLFALGGAYRDRTDEDCISLFKNALEENEKLALKCLFYLRDCRGGQGERRFFRICYKWLAKEYPDIARLNFEMISEYGRYDDMIYSLFDTPLEKDVLDFIKKQFIIDICDTCGTPSLLAKWLPSENCSSMETKRMGHIIRKYLNLSHQEYRQALSSLRKKINIVERLMSDNRWDEIEFDKIPSKAGLIYRNAFARRDIIAEKYKKFIESKDTKVNASVLYPYEIVKKAIDYNWNFPALEGERKIIEKYWENLPDYFQTKPCKMICVIDTSASMLMNEVMDVAIGLGMYCAERIKGPFKNCYISFSSRPQLVEIEGKDFTDKVKKIYKTNICENTDIIKTFRLLKDTALKSKPEDIPDTLIIISDMQIDKGSYFDDEEETSTEMEKMRKEWKEVGLKMPRLVYWNVSARGIANMLDSGENVTYVSGMSPAIFKQILTGANGYNLMIQTLESERYKAIK